ncbi:26S proteasome non-ATPase regulatory subunit 10-like [Daphnia carinata]|uniref:26S proteasome non-ATPase regulatory subunit 10-like n=1 Tax=Daphnia carinata TaxID=120202 RepID=UPI00257BD5E6|nr:26S proteasome non-ATPase regulatory subunit 10-like [Daphnia carinata]XP_059352056.1 26S proteasome non-ATPase regulatory subunit 10-like [Daphnia carinata]
MFALAVFWVFTLSTSLIAAICLFDLYRRQKRQSCVEKEDLDLICNLAKFPYEMKNEDRCITLMEKYQLCPNAFDDHWPHSEMTPFLSSCYGGSLKLIQFMLEAGADSKFQNLNGDGALYMATYGIACRLRSAQCPQQRSSEIQLGVLILDCLIKQGCDINSRNNFGFTPLHWAATTGEKWLVDHLLKRGADPSILTSLSRAPASAFAKDEVLQLLKEAENI